MSDDEDLEARTRQLLATAIEVAQQLREQNQRLAQAIENFHHDLLVPFRESEQ